MTPTVTVSFVTPIQCRPIDVEWKLAAAFAAVYLIWGSTFLAIRLAIETMPPFFMAAARFLGAGLPLYIFARCRGAARPTGRQWLASAVVGALLLLTGNGVVVWAEQRVPSGLAALLVGTVPLWMAVMEETGLLGPALRRGGAWWGPALGVAGIALLVGPNRILGGERPDLLGCVALFGASASWAAGSLYGRRAPLPKEPLLAGAMEMVAGGLMLVITGMIAGETHRLHPGGISGLSIFALIYLIVFGSIIGFSAYVWLLGHTTVARLSTYAFVNPVVALALGWKLAGETITPRSLAAAGLILGAVVLMLTRQPDETPVEL